MFDTQICTTLKQSKRLVKLGLKVLTSDCHYVEMYGTTDIHIGPHPAATGYVGDQKLFEATPAWSLHRLIDMLPDFLVDDRSRSRLNLNIDKRSLQYINIRGDISILFQQKDTIYDNIIDCIEWLIQNNYFNKEYLK